MGIEDDAKKDLSMSNDAAEGVTGGMARSVRSVRSLRSIFSIKKPAGGNPAPGHGDPMSPVDKES